MEAAKPPEGYYPPPFPITNKLRKMWGQTLSLGYWEKKED
jgi:hypothetical protein